MGEGLSGVRFSLMPRYRQRAWRTKGSVRKALRHTPAVWPERPLSQSGEANSNDAAISRATTSSSNSGTSSHTKQHLLACKEKATQIETQSQSTCSIAWDKGRVCNRISPQSNIFHSNIFKRKCASAPKWGFQWSSVNRYKRRIFKYLLYASNYCLLVKFTKLHVWFFDLAIQSCQVNNNNITQFATFWGMLSWVTSLGNIFSVILAVCCHVNNRYTSH